ncbi:hypothetical protein BJ508DRAFT_303257 [Ascobolus immersus RN42]|uniref:Uncharacterized protein n=1 Tax=Ascobolus immersus RN42 TaxID=1160509 RepID=A0A3N4IGV2_ASCIM|nr:hypothetical protein BJ508DRAFT_303257 [Ascobolus immersus RN42]
MNSTPNLVTRQIGEMLYHVVGNEATPDALRKIAFTLEHASVAGRVELLFNLFRYMDSDTAAIIAEEIELAKEAERVGALSVEECALAGLLGKLSIGDEAAGGLDLEFVEAFGLLGIVGGEELEMAGPGRGAELGKSFEVSGTNSTPVGPTLPTFNTFPRTNLVPFEMAGTQALHTASPLAFINAAPSFQQAVAYGAPNVQQPFTASSSAYSAPSPTNNSAQVHFPANSFFLLQHQQENVPPFAFLPPPQGTITNIPTSPPQPLFPLTPQPAETTTVDPVAAITTQLARVKISKASSESVRGAVLAVLSASDAGTRMSLQQVIDGVKAAIPVVADEYRVNQERSVASGRRSRGIAGFIGDYLNSLRKRGFTMPGTGHELTQEGRAYATQAAGV